VTLVSSLSVLGLDVKHVPDAGTALPQHVYSCVAKTYSRLASIKRAEIGRASFFFFITPKPRVE